MKGFDSRLHHRRSIRLKGYDYTLAGAYFVTINCQDRVCRFGEVVDDQMVLNEYGEVAYQEWLNLADRFPNFSFDVFQIMPDHIHAIIIKIDEDLNEVSFPDSSNKDITLGDVVGAYKSIVMVRCLAIYNQKNIFMGKFWLRNYYESIIRNERSYVTISNYIIDNPANWKKGRNPQR